MCNTRTTPRTLNAFINKINDKHKPLKTLVKVLKKVKQQKKIGSLEIKKIQLNL